MDLKDRKNVTLLAKQPGFISCFFKARLHCFNAVLFPGAVEKGCWWHRERLRAAGL